MPRIPTHNATLFPIVLVLVLVLLRTGTAQAVAASVGAGGSPAERLMLGYLLGLAGALPATGAVFALLNAMFCHPARSKWLQALGGFVLGCFAYALCVLAGSLSLGFLLDGENLMQGYAQYGEVSFWVLVFVVLYLPALPLALWSVLHARSLPKALRERGQA